MNEPHEGVGELTNLRDPGVPAADRDEGAPTDGAARISVRRLPGLVRRAARLAWAASRRELITCIALQVFIGIGMVTQLLLGRTVIEAIVDSGDRSIGDVTPTLVAMAVVTALLGFAGAALVERQELLAELVERHVQGRIIDVVTDVPLEAFESAGFHDRLRRATNNASERTWQVTLAVVSLFSALVTLSALAVVLLGIEPLIVPAVLVAYLPLYLATTRNSRESYEFVYWQTAPDRERAYLQHVLLGKAEAKEVRLFGTGDLLRHRYDALYDRRIHELRAVLRRRLRRSLIANAGSTAVTVGAVGALIHLSLSGRISPADAGVAAVALQQLGSRVRSLDANAGALHQCSLFLYDVVAFLDQPPPAPPDQVIDGPGPTGFHRLVVDGVSFTYPGTDRPVLDDVSLEIHQGEIVALVGDNGSGKTTLAKLLCGLYEPTAGRVLWDGTDVADHDPRAVRRRIAAVFQDFVRYELTGHDNIGLGDTERFEDLDAIRVAARAAGADDRLAGLAEGYATRLSRAYEGGAELSIGEWQRVALARAFFRDAPFLVLDEPTASLDARAERDLFEAMRQLQHGRAVLLISHRFSSVRSADRIYVLDHGRVIEQGSHDELMRVAGRYAELFTLQAAAYLDTPAETPGPHPS